MDPELQVFEQELLRTRPARVPPELSARLMAARPVPPRSVQPGPTDNGRPLLAWLIRFLIPATALVAAAWFVAHQVITAPRVAPGDQSVLLDNVRIDRQFVSSFDAIAQLPDGQPVRFRCAQWNDRVVLRNSATGFEIRQTRPRLEVIPVAFETD